MRARGAGSTRGARERNRVRTRAHQEIVDKRVRGVVLALAAQERLVVGAEEDLQAGHEGRVVLATEAAFGRERNAHVAAGGELVFRAQRQSASAIIPALADADAPIVGDIIGRVERAPNLVRTIQALETGSPLEAEPIEIELADSADLAVGIGEAVGAGDARRASTTDVGAEETDGGITPIKAAPNRS